MSLYLCGSPLPNPEFQSNHEKIIKQIQIEDFLQNIWPVLLKLIKTKELMLYGMVTNIIW